MVIKGLRGWWHCGMCGHFNPTRFRKRCQKCGAERGMGTRR